MHVCRHVRRLAQQHTRSRSWFSAWVPVYRRTNKPRYLVPRALYGPVRESHDGRRLQANKSATGANVRGADTIYALSTAAGRAAIAVIRISGPACLEIYRSLCPGRKDPRPRYATLRKLIHPDGDVEERVLDSGALVLYFPAPQTVTGEDVLELHVHGGPAIVKAVLDAIHACSSAKSASPGTTIRYAEPGEFTKRAFYNGRLDLTQAEALGESLSAETEQQRRLAVSGAGGALAERYEEWRKMLLYARGELEALIDFSEDQHFEESPQELVASITTQVVALRKQFELHVKNASKGELLRNGINVALLGAPNVGKSSLLNRIVGREAAIVSQEEGTTRDIVDVSVDIDGWLVKLGDMAGLRNKTNEGASQNIIGNIEQEGMRRARARALSSDVVIVLLSIERSAHGEAIYLEDEVLSSARACQDSGKALLVAVNKTDLRTSSTSLTHILSEVHAHFPNMPIVPISCQTNTIRPLLTGLTSLFRTLTTASTLPSQSSSYWTPSLGVTHRQSGYLRDTLRHLDDYLDLVDISITTVHEHHVDGHDDIIGEADVDIDIDIVAAAEHLRFAAATLGKITGRGEGGDVEDVLGVVFERFCVGK